MAIVVNCECGKSYKFRDDKAGKRTRCRECSTVIRVPDYDEYDDESDYSAPQQTAPKTKSRRRATSKQRQDSKPRNQKTAKPTTAGGSWSMDKPKLWIVTLAAITVVVGAGTAISPALGAPLSFGLLIIGALWCFVACMMLVVKGFKQKTSTGIMCLFVPFYLFYFVYKNWTETKQLFLSVVLATAASIVAQIVLALAALLFFSNAVNESNGEIQINTTSSFLDDATDVSQNNATGNIVGENPSPKPSDE
ncbi:MAG: hypothetical protein CMJ78_17885 [Planctomycetaceae bacterium]|nr:hypothetical protein [Planctomycetaceae bacterium]